jgi:RsiW-degrading membrane proteinase PrsW (M82 family)
MSGESLAALARYQERESMNPTDNALAGLSPSQLLHALEFLFALAIAPGIFWLWHFMHRDRLEPEPRGLVIKVFLWGAFAGIPIALVEFLLFRLVSPLYLAPVVEELGKFLVVYWWVYRCREFDEPMDGIVYGTAAALGFATLENIGYVVGAAAHGNALALAIVRALFSVPMHALCGALWGYALGRAKFLRPAPGRAFILGGLGLAMLLHGLFNFGAMVLSGSAWALVIPLVVMIVGWIMVNRRISDAENRSPFRRLAPPAPSVQVGGPAPPNFPPPPPPDPAEK